ncbi:MAG: N-acetylmuramoyl-L-alanine amidase [Clostridiaceae bacterium]|nr:N-acetylmuramoyl-L-alanine amidase [Clostridiaceae bacterium]
MKRFIAAFLLTISIISLSGSIIYAEKIPEPGSRGLLGDITYSSDEIYEQVHIKATGYTKYSSEILDSPDRIVIDLKNVEVPAGQGSIKAAGALVDGIRYSQFTSDIGRVVVDVKKGYDYSVGETDTGLIVYVCNEKAASERNDNNTMIFGRSGSIKKTGSGANEAVVIDLGRFESYHISRRSDPEELVVTIPDARVFGTGKELDVEGDMVRYVNYQKSGGTGAVITIGITAQYQYSAHGTDQGLVISFERPSYKNIRYNNNYDRVHFLIKNVSLTTGTKNLKPLYTYSRDRMGQVYTITFPSSGADIGEGMLDIGDEHLKSFEVRKNDNETTSFIFTGHPENDYVVFTRDSGDTAITVVRPAPSDRKLVVIDAGHGGTAIGAAYGKLIEKELNLDIAKRLESLLKEKGAQVYMLRSDDSNVDNYERVYIANALRAGLYLSIHHNGTKSNKTDGTMTLFCPSSKPGFTGKDFAKIIQEGMLSALKTTDRGLRTRPDLIVLRETHMPAALAEVAFLTNAGDRARLSSDAFRQKAAQSLCDSVFKALKRIS